MELPKDNRVGRASFWEGGLCGEHGSFVRPTSPSTLPCTSPLTCVLHDKSEIVSSFPEFCEPF